jgi:hypothetical protein
MNLILKRFERKDQKLNLFDFLKRKLIQTLYELKNK